MNFKVKIINHNNHNSLSQITAGIHTTPWGNCLITESEGALLGLTFCDNQTQQTILQDLATIWPKTNIRYNESQTKPWATLAIQSLTTKLPSSNLTPPPHSEKPLLLLGTPFQIKVWNALLELEVGEQCSYQDIAIKIGHPKAIRAVGNAVGKNRISLIIPCHRVLHKDGGIGGYAWGIERKKLLLDHERNN